MKPRFVLLCFFFAPAVWAQTASPTVTLQQCLDQAMANGPDLKVAQLTLASASAQLDQARGKNSFGLAASGAYSHAGTVGVDGPVAVTTATGQSASAPGEALQGGVTLGSPNTKVSVSATHTLPENEGIDQTSTLSVTATQNVFDGYPGGRNQATVQQAQYSFQVAQLSYDLARVNEVYQVEQAYFTLLGDERTVTTREQNLDIAKQDLARANAYLTAGKASSLDVLQSQIAERQAELDLASAQAAVSSARQSLSALVGWPIDKDYTVGETSAPASPTLDADAAVQSALSNRIELKQDELYRQSDAVGLKLTQVQNFPTVAVAGGAGYKIDWGGDASGGSWNAGVTVNVPILDSGVVSAQVKQSQDALDQLAVQEEQERAGITIAVRSAYFSVTDASNRQDLAVQNVDQAQRQYDLEKIKFQAGLASNLDVLNAQATLTTAQVALQTAKTNLILAILNLDKAMGTLGVDSGAN